MKELSSCKWKGFCIDNLFVVKIGKNIDGNKADKTGQTAYITRKETNNGLEGFIKGNSSLLNTHFPVITIGNETSKPFVQQYSFFTGTKVNILIPKENLSAYALQFVATSLENHKKTYSYSYTINSRRLKSQIILLPVTSEGTPDWQFMEDYMRQVEQELLKPVVEKLKERIGDGPLQTTIGGGKWKTFNFIDIFNIKKGFYNKKPPCHELADYPFIGATDSNNGITGFTTYELIRDNSKIGYGPNEPITKKIYPQNAICVTNNGSVGYAYFQPHNFTCTHDVNPLYLKDRELNRYLASYIICCIEKQRVCFEYARKWRPKRMVKSKLLLPVTDDGKPDWQYMEGFMRQVERKQLMPVINSLMKRVQI